MRFQNRSVAVIVALSLVAVNTVLLGTFGIFNYLSDRNRQWAELRQSLEVEADQLSTGLTLPVWNLDRAEIDKIIESIMEDRAIAGIDVKAAGKTHSRSRDAKWNLTAGDALPSSEYFLVTERSIVFENEPIGTARVMMSPRFIQAALRQSLFSGIAAVLLLDALLVLVIYLLLWREMLKPLQSIEKYAVAVSTGKPGSADILGKHFHGELFGLRNAIREMVGLLEKRYEELKRFQGHLEELVKERTAELAVAKNRAEESDRLKSAFLATMSHEVRTPLNSILGFTGILLQGMVGSLNPEQTKQLGMVQNSARHLLSLINDILDISKIEAGQLEITRAPLDVPNLVETVLETVRPLAQKKGLLLLCDIAEDVPAVQSDERRVKQILFNLVSNAIKFTERGEVRIACRLQNNRLVTEVGDTGIGIKPDDINKLFRPFLQIADTAVHHYEGTGLGLAISKRLLDLLGGDISVQSEWGKGAVFTFMLPIA